MCLMGKIAGEQAFCLWIGRKETRPGAKRTEEKFSLASFVPDFFFSRPFLFALPQPGGLFTGYGEKGNASQIKQFYIDTCVPRTYQNQE